MVPRRRSSIALGLRAGPAACGEPLESTGEGWWRRARAGWRVVDRVGRGDAGSWPGESEIRTDAPDRPAAGKKVLESGRRDCFDGQAVRAGDGRLWASGFMDRGAELSSSRRVPATAPTDRGVTVAAPRPASGRRRGDGTATSQLRIAGAAIGLSGSGSRLGNREINRGVRRRGASPWSLDGPARIAILLAELGRLGLPSLWHAAFLERLLLGPGVARLGAATMLASTSCPDIAR